MLLKFRLVIPKDTAGNSLDVGTAVLAFSFAPNPNGIHVLDRETLTSLGCPVQITQTDPLANVFGTTDPWGWEVRILYRNITDKVIVAEKFGVNYLDVTRDGHRSAWDYTASVILQPDGAASSHWGDGVYVNELGMNLKAEAWPIRILFSDDSVWQDDGSGKCKGSM